MMAMSMLVGRVTLLTRKNAPELLIGGGTITTLVGTALAVKAALTYKEKVSEPILTEYFDETTKSEAAYSGEQLEEALAHDKKVCRNKLIIETVKVFAPSVSFILAGVGMIGWGAGLAHARQLALSAALNASQETVRKLRESRESGDETVDVQHEVDGVKYTGQKEVPLTSYAQLFDWTNPNYSENDVINENFLNSMQKYCNDRLISRGHLFLNEVYDMLGFERTMAGSVVGWYFDGTGEHGGDEYVDYRAERIAIESEDGDIRYVYALDFNVDGPIYERLAA